MNIRLFTVLTLLALLGSTTWAQEPKKKTDSEKWVIEQVFPKKSFFGPSARSMAFSADGKYAAYLYRNHAERRHGNDLWILDTATGKKSRVTSVSVMAKYQEQTRKVQRDRVKKAKKRNRGKKIGDAKKKTGPTSKSTTESKTKKKVDKDGKKNAPEAGRGRGDFVDGKDADNKKAPRYAGISSFAWSPKKNELLFVSEGDLYRFRPIGRLLTRMTATRGSIRGAKYLPNGEGYVYRDDSAIIRVKFGEDLIDRIDPKLPTGESLQNFRISPNGKNLVLVTTESAPNSAKSRKVSIANYRDRFMKTREVSRHVSDDPVAKRKTNVYLCRIGDTRRESGKLEKIWTQQRTGPRDILTTPKWSERSDRVALFSYQQVGHRARIVQGRFLTKKERLERVEKKRKARARKRKQEAQERKEAGKKPKSKKKATEPSQKEELEKEAIAEGKMVYEFMHSGGPTTPRMMTPYFLADGKRIVILTEQSGFRHLHVLDPVYASLDQLTRGRFEVYPIDISKDRKWLFVTSTKGRPSCQDPFKVNLETGEMVPLTKKLGTYSSVAVSHDGHHVLANFVRYGRLRELVYLDTTKGEEKVLTHSHTKIAARMTKTKPEFFHYKNRHGQTIYGHMFKPSDLKVGEKRPLLIYVYGGPLGKSKQVTEGNYSSDSYFFAQYMTRNHGYITCTIDPRGMSGYGGAFERANFGRVGRPQVDDLVDGVKFMVASQQVDPKRVAIHGWSFGGFQTQMCLYTEPDVFKCGMAGAGPTEWENYNSWYSTGTIGNSRVGKTDLKKYSLLPLAKNLEGELLLVHGMEDSNVLYQDTVRVYRELLKAGKETHVELFLDPTGGHGLGGDVKRVNRARKYEEFLLRNL